MGAGLVAPRSVHLGTVMAAGLWFPPGTPGLLQRVLDVWNEGSAFYEVGAPGPGGHFLEFSQPRRLDTALCPGLALVRQGRGLTSYPMCGEFRQDCLGLLWQGQLFEVARCQLEPFPLGTWVATVFVDVAEGEALSLPAGPPLLALPPVFDAREELPSVPPPSPLLQTLLDRWNESGSTATGAASPKSAPSPSPVMQWVVGAWDSIRGRFAPSHNQRYLKTMIELFEGGDLQEALRYGIPIGQLPGEVARMRMGWLRPRQHLSILPPGSATGIIPVSAQGEGYLKALYRRAAQRLLEAGRIEEAVFVYVQLLGEDYEALRILEEHRMLRVAARLAEARKLPAPTRIRLWFLAGELEQALEVARRSGQYLQAFHELEKKEPERAKGWLWEWGLYLLQGNRHAAAIQLLWSQRQEHPEMREWLAPALEAGGGEAGRALALWLSDPLPDQEQSHLQSVTTILSLRQTAQGWLQDSDPAQDSRVWGLVEGLRSLPRKKSHRLVELVSGMCARELLKRAAQGRSEVIPQHFQQLVKMSEDALLKADLPVYAPPPPKPDKLWQELLRGRGTAPILDAALLPDGRLLCALGEAGLLVLNARGRRLALLPVPCERIVVPCEGDRFLLLCSRGPERRLVWLESSSLKTWPWASVRLADFCSHYDGHTWLVVVDEALFQIDVHSSKWRSLWKIPLSGTVDSLSLGSNRLGLLLSKPGGTSVGEFYSYQDLQLRTRCQRQTGEGKWLSATDEAMVEAHLQPGAGGLEVLGQRLLFAGPSREEAFQGPLKFIHGTMWSVVEAPGPAGVEVWAVRRNGRDRPAHFVLEGASQVTTRLQEHLLVMADDVGNCRVADLLRRDWIRNLRI